MQENYYVIGHKNPDTDTIASAIAYSELKNALGYCTIAGRLGPMNEETRFVMRYFNVESPFILKDARCKLRDIEFDKVVETTKEASCNDAFEKAIKTNNKTIYVTEKGKLIGIVSISDLTHIRLGTAKEREKLLSKSNTKLIAKDLNGKVLIDSKDFKVNGKVLLVQYANLSNINNSIVIATDDKELYIALKNDAGLVIYNGEKVVDKSMLDDFKKNDIPLISTKMGIEDIFRLIYEAIPLKEVMTVNYHSFNADDFIEDVHKRIISTRFRAYPVIDEKGHIIGSISRYHLFNYKKKKFILVDHSSFVQSINNLKSAEVVEIVDHHHIGDIQTNSPIYYRNERLGSTCSIVYKLYKENGIKPTKSTAGLMLSAIISDTLNFQSKTTTELDKKYASELAKIAKIDIKKYAKELLNASVNLDKANLKELITRDCKEYKMSGYKVEISQTNYVDMGVITKRLKEIKEEVASYQETKKLDLMVMMFTNVNGSGTFFVTYGSKKDALFDIIEDKFDDNTGFDKTIMSRKQQLVPMLSNILNQY